ncbi:MAG: YeeE/YedE family protein [bacterium]|nr:YeeE/YedE family protein [bacterium]
MTAPFYPTGAFGDETGFLIIFVLGFFFGFFLERAGFGSARKLAAIFYFKDFAVLRVMFTAILVAMLGVLYLSSMGWMEMEAVNVPATYLGAQIAGGLLLGIGFVVGGYCPGTSVVAAASGKLDALAYIAGILFGVGIFGVGYDSIQPLYHWGERGVVTLEQWSGWNSGILAFVIVAIALAAFAATEYADRKKRQAATPALEVRLTWQRAFATLAVVLAFGLLSAHSVAGQGGSDSLAEALAAGDNLISPTQLDGWLNHRKPLTLVDLRTAEDHARYHIPGSANLPLDLLTKADLPADRPLILYSSDGAVAGQGWALLAANGIKATILKGGIEGWRKEVLNQTGETTQIQQAAPPPKPSAPAIKIPIRRFKKGSSCS